MGIQCQKHRSGTLTVTTVTIARSPMNILDTAHCQDLTRALEEIRDEGESRIVVIRGGGKCFSTGVEIQEHTPAKLPALLPAFHDVFERLLDLPSITVAAVHGYCLGGAAELALACDRVIATSDARIGFPETRVGCYPPVALPLLSSRAGTGRAVELVLEGKEAPVRDLVDWGLVHASEGTDLDALIAREISRYHDKSPAIVGMVARHLHEEARAAWAHRIRDYEKFYLEEVLPHPDASEGIGAFLERRPPRWQ